MGDSESLKALRKLEEVVDSLIPILEEISELKKLIPEDRYKEITKKLRDARK